MSRTAVVLFNLGGPDRPEAVAPFLFNLFNDPAIIDLPRPFRWLLAKVISSRRAPIAREIYGRIGGRSPLLELTRAQAEALESALGSGDHRVFVAMRYWHPFAAEVAREVVRYGPDRVVLLPLYPQFSTTTSASSLADWRRAAAAAGLRAPSAALCCYPTGAGLIEAQADLIGETLARAPADTPIRLLFSAHGLPRKIVARGDPYAWQVEQTAAAVAARLAQGRPGKPALDWAICYQSRVGRLEWIGPATEAEIARAGRDGVALVVAPIAFVSEHSETLVELDMEYRDLAARSGVPAYLRVPALGTHAAFVAQLADLVRGLEVAPDGTLRSGQGGRICPAGHGRCALAGGPG